MVATVCPNCQRRGAVAPYLAGLPLRCVGCGHGLTIGGDVPEEPPAPLMVTIAPDPDLPPLVPLAAAPTSGRLTLKPDESLSPTQLSDLLQNITTLSATPPRPSAPASFWKRLWRAKT